MAVVIGELLDKFFQNITKVYTGNNVFTNYHHEDMCSKATFISE